MSTYADTVPQVKQILRILTIDQYEGCRPRDLKHYSSVSMPNLFKLLLVMDYLVRDSYLSIAQ